MYNYKIDGEETNETGLVTLNLLKYTKQNLDSIHILNIDNGEKMRFCEKTTTTRKSEVRG